MNNKPVIAVIGPTATGKTRRAVDLARELNGEIISGDSRQVYRGMDLGTGKDLVEYGNVPYHLIDIVPAGEKYNLYEFLRDANSAIETVRLRNKQPIVCGGTGLYIESLLKGMKMPEVPENKSLRESLEGKSLEELTAILSKMKLLHNITDVDTVKRAIRAIEIQTYYIEHPDEAANVNEPAPIDAVIIGVDIDRDARRRRITQRLDTRLTDGMVDEVKGLIASGVKPDDLIYYGLEYKYVTQYVIGQISFEEMRTQLEIAIHRFAKRQMTWFRGMERRGFKINWLPYDLPANEFVARVIEIFDAHCDAIK